MYDLGYRETNLQRAKGRCTALDLVTVFRICFVVGLVAIPVLYLLFGRGAAGRNQNRMRNEDARGEPRRMGHENSAEAPD